MSYSVSDMMRVAHAYKVRRRGLALLYILLAGVSCWKLDFGYGSGIFYSAYLVGGILYGSIGPLAKYSRSRWRIMYLWLFAMWNNNIFLYMLEPHLECQRFCLRAYVERDIICPHYEYFKGINMCQAMLEMTLKETGRGGGG